MPEEPRPQRTVEESITRLAQIMTPSEANVLGKVFGGAILSLIDLCASATAQKFSGHICVTASFDRVDFHEPIEVGELVTLEGTVTHTGRTSLEVTIDVSATNLVTGSTRHTNTARVTMVALKEGRPTMVPELVFRTVEDKRRYLTARVRRELRERLIADLEAARRELQSASETDLDSMIGRPRNPY